MSNGGDLFAKAYKYEDAKKLQAMGLYPYFRAITASTGNNVVTAGKRQVMIGSNNYLGLTHDLRVMEAARDAITKYGTGCTGSRFLNGNLDLHEELERRLARFVGKEAALCFSTGFFVNQGTLGALIGRSDVIYSDRENHASIVEGTQVALGDTIRFRHNDMEDLERVLKNSREKYEGAMIVADGVFSMSGDILNLPPLVELAKKYGCKVYVDDAHALGVLGPKGEGTAQHFSLVNDVDLVMGTFSKSFASIGGFIAGKADVVHYIKHKARPFMFSAAMSPASAATALKCLDIMETETQHLESLRKNAKYMSDNLKSMGFNTLNSRTPVIPLLIGDDVAAFAMTQKLCEEGVFVTPVVRPAVPEGCALLRTSYMASHTKEDLDYALKHLEKIGKEFGVLGNAETTEKLNKLALQNFGVHA
ncbi:MAG: aminotransferase class I/II-fold pyridoxal phosphate-dependent enzyme [Bdellovibrionales bacterium]|nr:aminotransferase class I/II-fold pyridoxal phosphate-dependent enzyme [Bdellovibrionales bacterium]